MTQDVQTIKKDRLRYTKDSFSSTLAILAIVFDCLYFVSIYQSDVGTYYYNWLIGVSIVYNLIFLLAAFLASESVKNRRTGYSGILVVLGVALILLALGLFFFWLFVWFIGGAIAGFVNGVIKLGDKFSSREVSA